MRYFGEDGRPILRCPICGEDWHLRYGISAIDSRGEHLTNLNIEGSPVEIEGRLVEASCGGCGTNLAEMAEVTERR